MIRTETGYASEIGQGQPVIQVGFDVVSHSLQALAGQPVRRFEQERRLINKTPRDLHRECRIQRIGQDAIDKTAADLVGKRHCYLRNQRIAKRIVRIEMHGTATHQFGEQIFVGLTTLQNLNKPAAGQIAPQFSVARSKGDVAGPKSIFRDGPIIALFGVAYIAQDAANAIIVALPNHLARGAKKHAGRDKPQDRLFSSLTSLRPLLIGSGQATRFISGHNLVTAGIARPPSTTTTARRHKPKAEGLWQATKSAINPLSADRCRAIRPGEEA